jgi:hypothetical protein
MYFRTTKGKVIMNQGFFGGEIENWLLSGYLDIDVTLFFIWAMQTPF